MKRNKKVVILVFFTIAILVVICLFGKNFKKNDFHYWRAGSESLVALQNYVKDVTNANSKNFIPVENRIAVFDMDGTLYGEKAPIYVDWWMYVYRVLNDSSYKASKELVEVANKIVEASKNGIIPEELELQHAVSNAEAYANMTLDEYKDYVATFIKKDAEGFTGMSYADAWYLPMLEVINYLNKNDFTLYICSGTDRFLIRELANGKVNIPKRQIIGMDVLCIASGQGETDGLDYNYTDNDDVIRSKKLIIKSVKANKVSQIAQEIGAKPVLSFGNSSGDLSMSKFTLLRNPYKSMAFMVVADDTEREYGDIEKAKQASDKWKANGCVPISMKDDWSTIYGDKVIKNNVNK